MKKTSLFLLAALLLALVLSACGQDSPTAAPTGPSSGTNPAVTSEPAVTKTDQSTTEGETEPTQPGPSETQPVEVKSDFAELNSTAFRAWAAAQLQDPTLYWGNLEETVMNWESNTRLIGRFSTEGELTRLEISLNGGAADAAGSAFLLKAVKWLDEKLNADFSEARAYFENGGTSYSQISSESGDWALTVGSDGNGFWVTSSEYNDSPLPFTLEEAFEILETEDPDRFGAYRNVSVDLSRNNYLALKLDPEFRLCSGEYYCYINDPAEAAALLKKAAEPFLKEEAFSKAAAFFDEKTASVLSSGESASLELAGGTFDLYNIGSALYLSIEPEDRFFSKTSFVTEEDLAELKADPFDAIGFSKAGTVAGTDLGEIDGCRIMLNKLVYGEPGYNGPEVGLRFTVSKQTEDAVMLNVTLDRLDNWKGAFVKKLELPAGSSGELTRTVWIPVSELRNFRADLNGLSSFTLSLSRGSGSERQYLVQDLPIGTGYEQNTVPEGTVIMDGEIYMLLLDEAFPLIGSETEERTLYSSYRYRVYLENRSDRPLAFQEYGKQPGILNGFYLENANNYVKMPEVKLEPGERALGGIDINIILLRTGIGQTVPESLDYIPVLTTYAEDSDQWVKIEEPKDRLKIEAFPAVEIPERYVSTLEQQKTVFTETETLTVYEDEDMLIQTVEWMTDREDPHLVMVLSPKNAEPMSVYMQVTYVNGTVVEDSAYVGIILRSYEGAKGCSYISGLKDLGLNPDEYETMTLTVRKGQPDEASSGGFNYFAQDPVTVELDLKP